MPQHAKIREVAAFVALQIGFNLNLGLNSVFDFFTYDFIVAVCQTHCISWILLDAGIEISEQTYKSDSWNKARRLVIVRQRIKDRK